MRICRLSYLLGWLEIKKNISHLDHVLYLPEIAIIACERTFQTGPPGDSHMESLILKFYLTQEVERKIQHHILKSLNLASAEFLGNVSKVLHLLN